ncbi:MAG TPA: PilZ domain-containing protein [Symbiobacteriaceae bacterium]|nr:PilZ domain-containing protein [Symbiobacteriaceae bacterium]
MTNPENRREYFRIPLDMHPAQMQILEVGQRPITTHPRTVHLLNASGGGLYLQAEDDLPVRRGVIAQFEFTLGQTNFSFRGVLIRKLDDRETYKYGVEFIDMDEYQRGLLCSVLGRLQVELNRTAGL